MHQVVQFIQILKIKFEGKQNGLNLNHYMVNQNFQTKYMHETYQIK